VKNRLRRETSWSMRQSRRRATEALPIATRLRRLIFALWTLVLVAAVTAVGALQIQAHEVNELTSAIGPAFDANGEVLQAMTDAETGLLGYQASLDAVLLTPFRGAEARTMAALSTLKEKLGLPRGTDALDAGLEARQRRAAEQWWTYATSAQAAVGRGERTDVAKGDALFVSFREANAALGGHLRSERDQARRAAETAGAAGTATSIAVTLAALVAASVLGRRAARSMTQPVAELRDTMTRQQGGELDARAREDQGSIELRSLAADFNTLTEQNLGLNAELSGRLTELRRVNAKLLDAQQLLTHRSLHDPLTELPNRMLFLDRLDHSLAEAVRSGRRIAVYFIDIDGFKRVNDTFGHQAGDELLQEVAARLSAVVRPGDTVARFAGDEFLMLTVGNEDEPPVALADRVLASLLDPPMQVWGETVTASMGVAVSGEGDQPEQLLHEADSAMYRAKRAGGARWVLFRAEAPSEPGHPQVGEQRPRLLRSGDDRHVPSTNPWVHPVLRDIPPRV
jgi:diguanylate cyclase (GGDEF)-like protein